METCEQQTFQDFEVESQCYRQVCPASRRVLPGSNEAQKTTVGSGRQLSMLLDQSSPLGAFSRILLESSAWTSSQEYSYIWKRLDTKFALSAFQLTPLEQSTEDSACSLLPTPIRKDAEQGSGRGHHLKAEADKKAGTRLYEAVTQKLWPTPQAHDAQQDPVMTSKFKIQWIDSGREPTEKPDPRYPNGIDLDPGGRGVISCLVALPYPARRCGHYLIQCNQCKMNAIVTTAGRPDDPRSVWLPCKIKYNS